MDKYCSFQGINLMLYNLTLPVQWGVYLCIRNWGMAGKKEGNGKRNGGKIMKENKYDLCRLEVL